VKNVFPPLPQGNGVIRVGGYDYGLAAEIYDDEQGHVWRLLGLLDGTRTMPELAAAMQQFDPAVTPADVTDALEALIEAGYIEDDALEPPAVFSTPEVERYRRNFDFFSYFHQPPLTKYDFQIRLKNARVTVLGVGGLGSYVALSLAAAGVGHLRIVDHDVVEASNLNRQVLYTDRDLGVAKVDAARRRLTEVNPHVAVEAWNEKISSVEDARRAVSGQDLLICAADRPRVRIYDWINEAALLEHTPWIRGANDGLTVNSFFHVPGKTACFECVQTWSREKHAWFDEVLCYVQEQIGDRTVNPCTSPVAGLIGHLTALEALKFLTGIAEPAFYGRKLTFNLQTLETLFGPVVERHPRCRQCGQGAREQEAAASCQA
jgi:molybdopterin/thiamine biosynthesis adenylyltransferase